jgi:hypothetical protein
MRRTIAVCVLSAAFSFAALAQLGPGKEVELTREAIQARRQAIVELAVDLTPKESAQFWPLYQEWRAKATVLGDRRLDLLRRIEDTSQTASEAEIKAGIDEWLKLEQDTLSLRKTFVRRFQKVVPQHTVARFFQLESKLDSVVNYDLAGRVPLVEKSQR